MLEQGLLVMYLAQHDDSKASGVKRLLVISNAPTLRIQTSIGIISSIGAFTRQEYGRSCSNVLHAWPNITVVQHCY